MKRIILLSLVILTSACATDNPWRLTEDIGSITLDTVLTSRFEYFLPGTGTFEFEQNSKRSTVQNKIETSVRIKGNDADKSAVNFEMYLFNDTNFTAQNLDFLVKVNVEKDSAFKVIASDGETKIHENNFHISKFSNSSDDLSGCYSGPVHVFRIEQDTLEITEDVFSVFGSVDTNNNLFLLTREEEAIFDLITGVFSVEQVNAFIGKAVKDNSTFDLSNEGNSIVGVSDSLTFNLTFRDNQTDKNLTIYLTKIQ